MINQNSSTQIDQDNQDNQSLPNHKKHDFNKPKYDRILKDINLKKIIINVSMTQYPVVTDVAEDLDWKVQTHNQTGDWDIFWTDFSIQPDVLIKMHLHQKINHFPGIYIIARKNLLGLNLMTMRSKFPDQYNFFPLTWMLPSQYSQFRMYYQSVTPGKVRTYIVKPQAQCQGRGIFLTRNIQNLQNGSHYVIQRYINKPYLIDGLKFDFRIYVLLAGTDPLRIYLYQQGLARFATQSYVQPTNANLDKNFIHLTNYAINKLNPKFVFNKGVNDMSSGHKRSLTSVYKILEKKGENILKLKEKIKDIIVKTLITSNPLISHQYRYCQPEEYSSNMCFHILGFDILLTQSCQPLLLQVNHTPSFTTDTPLDTHIKYNIIKDTLILMDINLAKKSALYKKAKLYNNQRLTTGKRQIFQGQAKEKAIQLCQAQRDQYQSKHLGGYQKIYPVNDIQRAKKYKQLQDFATKNYLQLNTERAKIQKIQARKMMRQQRKAFREKRGKLPQANQKKSKRKSSVKRKQKKRSEIESPKKKISEVQKSISLAEFESPINMKKNSQIILVQNTLNNKLKYDSQSLVLKKQQNGPQKQNPSRQMNLNQLIRMTKQSISNLDQKKIYNKYISIHYPPSQNLIHKNSKPKLCLPSIAVQPLSATVERPVQTIQLRKHSMQIRRINQIQYLGNFDNNFDKRTKFTTIKKIYEEVSSNHSKSSNSKQKNSNTAQLGNIGNINNRSGNFVIPKLLDINMEQKPIEKHYLIKLDPALKQSYRQ